MDCFENFDPVDGDVPGYPFFELFKIAYEARELLEGLSKVDIQKIEKNVDLSIEVAGDLLTRAKQRNNPDADLDDYDVSDQFTEGELLEFSIQTGQAVDDEDSPRFSPVKYAAVLALMHTARCIETLQCPEEDLGSCEGGPEAARLIAAANDAIEAATALGIARKYKHEEELEADIESGAIEIVGAGQVQALAAARSELARNAAFKSHAANRAAKALVFEWCDKNMSRFKSMDDAAMDIAESFIPQKFRAVRDWMTEWKKLRSASKP